MIMHRSLRLLALVPAALSISSCIDPSPLPARQAEPRIVFSSTRDGNEEIYTMNSDGTNQTRITNNNAQDTKPVWSPDGTQIAFVSTRSGNADIWIMNPDGSGLRNVTSDPANDIDPAWSPDGARLAFSSNRVGNQEIYVMNPDGTHITRLTENGAVDVWPVWSPDGRYIAFQSNRLSATMDIFALLNTTNEVTRITGGGGDDLSPSWSPDGLRLIWTASRDGNFEIYQGGFDLKTATAPVQTNLTNNPAADGRAAWSFNGRTICFVSNRAGGNNDIWTMNADGTNPVRLTTDPGSDDFCSIK